MAYRIRKVNPKDPKVSWIRSPLGLARMLLWR
jgi:hypothetical protein